MKQKQCSYCGEPISRRLKNQTVDHVFPDCLYSSAEPKSTIQRLTIPCCLGCNNSWHDDETHFRNVLTLAGDPPTATRKQLFATTVTRSFEKEDGLRRLNDLIEIMKPVATSNGPRHKISPADDERVLRVLRKIVRGLSHYHNIMTAVPDDLVSVDILRPQIPNDLAERMIYCHRDPNIVEYRYDVLDQGNTISFWLITFFKTMTFVGTVARTPAA